MGTPKGPKILFIMDYQISRERAGLLSRTIHGLKRYFNVELIQNAEIKEIELLNHQLAEFQLVLAPLNLYLTWHKVEGFFGINRTSGATFAGYIAEPISIGDLPGPDSGLRRIILDFVHLDAGEITTLIHALAYENLRTGLSPLLDSQVPIFYEHWYGRQDHGKRVEHFLDLPDIKDTPWNRRSSAIRILLNALWSLIYEEGPGKRDLGSLSLANQAPMASFQAGMDARFLVLRLFFRSYPRLTPKETIQLFWPDPSIPTRSPQLLVAYSDFIRVNSFLENGDIEVVVGLMLSAPSEKKHDQARTIWIEPCSPKLLLEKPYDIPTGDSTRYKSLPDVATAGTAEKAQAGQTHNEKIARETVIDATAKFEALKRKAAENAPAAPSRSVGPDPESLLEAFQQRYFEARQQIRQFEIQIANIEKKGTRPQELKTLHLKMEALLNRQRHWIKRLVEMLESYKKETLRKNKGNGP